MPIGMPVTFTHQGYKCKGVILNIRQYYVTIEITEVSGTAEQILGGTLGTDKLPSGTIIKHYSEIK